MRRQLYPPVLHVHRQGDKSSHDIDPVLSIVADTATPAFLTLAAS